MITFFTFVTWLIIAVIIIVLPIFILVKFFSDEESYKMSFWKELILCVIYAMFAFLLMIAGFSHQLFLVDYDYSGELFTWVEGEKVSSKTFVWIWEKDFYKHQKLQKFYARSMTDTCIFGKEGDAKNLNLKLYMKPLNFKEYYAIEKRKEYPDLSDWIIRRTLNGFTTANCQKIGDENPVGEVSSEYLKSMFQSWAKEKGLVLDGIKFYLEGELRKEKFYDFSGNKPNED